VFKQPVFVGDIVSFYAETIKIGNTSITVDVEVFAQRNPRVPEVVKVTEAVLTYVAIDENRQPRPVKQNS
jgi:acyl-CoA thioesterase YciA